MISAQSPISSVHIEVTHHFCELGLLRVADEADQDLVRTTSSLITSVAPNVPLGGGRSILNTVDITTALIVIFSLGNSSRLNCGGEWFLRLFEFLVL